MEGHSPSTLATSGAMGGLNAVSNTFDDDYCPYPPAQPGLPWWLTAVLGHPGWCAFVLLFVLFYPFGIPSIPGIPRWFKTITGIPGCPVFPRLFKRFTKQRLLYALLENLMLMAQPYMLDPERFFMKTLLLGVGSVPLFFRTIQSRVPHPPLHLMSSAPSNSPGILTVLKKRNELAKKCKYQDKLILTSDDFPVLPAQPRIFRTVDGFGNCPYSPHIGQAAQPYSFVATCKPPKLDSEGQVIEKNHPPPEEIFEKLFQRDTFEPNEAGLNCLILDFATLLTHDLFNSNNGYNANSSYADLSPLYGNDAESARRVRMFKRGLLDLRRVPHSRAAKPPKPPQPDKAGNDALQALDDEDKMNLWAASKEWNWDWGFAGWRALVEVFGKEHNHVAGKLLEWYPETFSHKFVDKQEDLCEKYEKDGLSQDNSKLKGKWINDELLYQTARYITTRIYGNIIVTDYASNFLGLKQLSDFTPGRPEMLGNSCSYEFGLLYHWHCLLPDDGRNAKQVKGVPCLQSDEIISRRGPLDGDYYDQLEKLEPGKCPHERNFTDMLRIQEDESKKEKDRITQHKERIQEEMKGADKVATAALRVKVDNLTSLEQEIDPLPETEIKLDDLLLERYKTPIGRFGAFHTPKYLEKAEIRTMLKARMLGVGSYNDFREHLKLMRCTTYEEINPDPKVAKALRGLYECTDKAKGNENVDDVELYPGIFAERSGHNGIKFGNVLNLGLLEDALNLIRNDRLLVDFDAATATAKGYHHAVTSHLADVIERNTGLKLVKKQEGSTPVLVDYQNEYPAGDWRHWRLASASMLTVPDYVGTARKTIFEGTNSAPGVLVKYPQRDSVPAAETTPAVENTTAVATSEAARSLAPMLVPDPKPGNDKAGESTPRTVMAADSAVGTPRP